MFITLSLSTFSQSAVSGTSQPVFEQCRMDIPDRMSVNTLAPMLPDLGASYTACGDHADFLREALISSRLRSTAPV